MTYLFDMNTKICFKCNIEQAITEFYKHPQMLDGTVNKCKSCNKKDVQKNYQTKLDKYKEYDKNRQRTSLNRILSHRYNAMRQRVEGRGKHKYSSMGMEILSRIEFMKWYENTKEQFESLYDNWAKSGFTRKLTPSVDRINNNKGYTADNMQWITQSENSRKYTS